VPISQSKVPQLANLTKILGRQGGCVRVLVDHPSQCLLLQQISQLSGYPTYILINVDITGQNSGLQPHSRDFRVLFSQIEQHALRDGPFMFTYVGLFSKIGSGPQSVDVSTAVQSLGQELRTLFESSPVQGVRLSIFADQSPLCVPAMASSQSGDPVPYDLSSIERTLGTISETEDSLEVHTTDYCLSDIQCVNTLTNLEVADTLFDQIGSMPLTILTEVISIYHDRDENLARPLIGIGSEILGRSKSDICANWGIAKQWNVEPRIIASDLHHLGWTVDHVERGSSILKWAGSEELMQPLHFGQRLRIHPNDATSASDAFGWYFVVDSSRVGREDEIIDVFVRWRA
jgi:D-serine deaminase-like pyridoxal phosphate-dependent protein